MFTRHLRIAISSILIVSILTMSISLFTPRIAEAQGGGSSQVPISTDFDWHSIKDYTKEFVLNSLAWTVAKLAIQQITSSIINWVNSGFEGSPAFLTNPEGFFLDLGDELTGAFISETGVLADLCSPWSIDIRLAIGLGQTQRMNQRYACTLGTIIDNARNASINGYSIEGYLSGDFKQGGWPSFLALTTEPQNNIYGTYLQAKSDLEAQIYGRQSAVREDLNRGSGFLSFEKCTTAIVDAKGSGGVELGLDSRDLVQLNNTGSVTTGNGSKYRAVRDNETGKVMYQTCQTETPGSVIESQLTHNLGSGVRQLELADSINEIVSAVLAQLVTQVLTEGLGATTRRTGGTTQSYVDRLYAESTGSQAYSNSARSIQGGYAPYVADARQNAETYREIAELWTNVRTTLNAAEACFAEILNDNSKSTLHGEARTNINAIQTLIRTQIATAESTYSVKAQEAQDILNEIEYQVLAAEEISNAQDAQIAAANLDTFVSTRVDAIMQGKVNAATDLNAAKASTSSFAQTAAQYMATCNALNLRNTNNRTR